MNGEATISVHDTLGRLAGLSTVCMFHSGKRIYEANLKAKYKSTRDKCIQTGKLSYYRQLVLDKLIFPS